jgi:hypothetical protein
LEVPERWLSLAQGVWDGPWLLLDLNSESLGPAGDQPDRRLGFYLAIYRTPVSDPEQLKVNYGTVPSSFGWLYATEATAMPFETFADRIRSRNTFPAKLDWGAQYTFTTPEEPARAFEFWMRPDQFKYVPRIFMVDGQPVLIDGFTSLPLVDGPYLQASGHEGRLEIRGPGQDPASAPLVLDFRQPLNPIRTDNADSWPPPLIDRARAIMAYALDLIGKARAPLDPGKPIDPLDYLRSAVDVFRGFNPPATVQVEYLLAYGQAVHVLVAFLLGIGGTDEDLTDLDKRLDGLSLTAQALDAQQAAVDILSEFTPAEADRLDYQIAVAEARHNLIARLLENSRPADAAELVAQTLTAYREYAAAPGADLTRVARDLAELAGLLAAAGLTAEAADVQRTLDRLTRDERRLAAEVRLQQFECLEITCKLGSTLEQTQLLYGRRIGVREGLTGPMLPSAAAQRA